MNAFVGLMDGLGLDGDRCIRVIPRQKVSTLVKTKSAMDFLKNNTFLATASEGIILIKSK